MHPHSLAQRPKGNPKTKTNSTKIQKEPRITHASNGDPKDQRQQQANLQAPQFKLL
jgi:hypothetical protein